MGRKQICRSRKQSQPRRTQRRPQQDIIFKMTKIRVKENVKSTNRKATSHVQGTPTKQPVGFLAETVSGGQSGVA